MSEPATPKQVNYIPVLARQLRELLHGVDPGGVVAKLDHATHTPLSKQDAMLLIDVLKGAIAHLKDPDRVAPVVPIRNAPSPTLTPAQERMRTYDEREKEITQRQDRWFGKGAMRRPAPPGKKYIKVWQEQRNRVGLRFHDPFVISGWIWECRHPDHARMKSKCVRGGSMLGRNTAMTNALRHWDKYHKDSEN